jgi:putative flippase GtrA
MSAPDSVNPGIFGWRRLPPGLRYLGVGIFCAGFYNVLLISIVLTGIGYVNATMIAFFPMCLVGYGMHVGFTFEKAASLRDFLRYCLGALIAYPIWLTLLFFLFDIFKLPIYLATPIGTLILFFWNFVATHWAFARSVRATWRRS